MIYEGVDCVFDELVNSGFNYYNFFLIKKKKQTWAGLFVISIKLRKSLFNALLDFFLITKILL